MPHSYRTLRLLGILFVASFCFCGCDSSSKPLVPDSEDIIGTAPPSDEPNELGIVDRLQTQKDLENTEVAAIDLPDDINELMASLARKQIEQERTRDPETFFRIQKYRFAAAKKLLGMKINQAQRIEFTRIKINAPLNLASLGDAAARNEFPAVIKTHAADSQPRIRQAVAIASLTHDVRQSGISDDPSMQPLVEVLTQIADEWPDNFDVCRSLGDIVMEVSSRGDRDSSNRMAWALINAYQNSSNAGAQKYIRNLESQVRVASANLDLITREIRDQQAGAMDRYQEAIQFLLNDETADPNLVPPILASLAWLERTGMTQPTLDANEIVTTAAAQLANPTTRQRLLDQCQIQGKRLGLLGKPFSITAWKTKELPFDWVEFSRDHAVVVVFWSPTEAASLRLLQQLLELPEFSTGQGTRLLAVNVSQNTDTQNLFPHPAESLAVVFSLADANANTFQEAMGIDRVPQVLLVDRKGVVIDVNPQPNRLKLAIEGLAN